jgi:hypothetical protein
LDIQHVFVDLPPANRLSELKATILATGRLVRKYRARWTGIAFDGVEALGNAVLEDLWSGVLRDDRYVSKTAWVGGARA